MCNDYFIDIFYTTYIKKSTVPHTPAAHTKTADKEKNYSLFPLAFNFCLSCSIFNF